MRYDIVTVDQRALPCPSEPVATRARLKFRAALRHTTVRVAFSDTLSDTKSFSQRLAVVPTRCAGDIRGHGSWCDSRRTGGIGADLHLGASSDQLPGLRSYVKSDRR